MIKKLIAILVIFLLSPILCSASVEIKEDKISIDKWTDGSAMTIYVPEALKTSKFKTALKDGKQEYSKSDDDIGLKVYALDAKAGMENGGVEYEYILNKKPATNSFPLSIDLTGLVAFYQPELTQKEIDEGLSRPENVIGSYAVYHSTKKNHELGGVNYKAGKAFHIYRPKAFDANGVEVWCEYNTDFNTTGVLVTTCPQSFLDTAVYPVVVDPTLGDTDGGASCDTGCTHIQTQWAAIGSTVTVTGVSIKASESDTTTPTFTGAIYSDSSNVPATRLALGSSGVAIPVHSGGSCSQAAYIESTISSYSLTSQTIWAGGAYTGSEIALNVTYDTGNDGFENNADVAPPASPWSTADDTPRAGRQYSTYITYTVPTTRRIISIQ